MCQDLSGGHIERVCAIKGLPNAGGSRVLSHSGVVGASYRDVSTGVDRGCIATSFPLTSIVDEDIEPCVLGFNLFVQCSNRGVVFDVDLNWEDLRVRLGHLGLQRLDSGVRFIERAARGRQEIVNSGRSTRILALWVHCVWRQTDASNAQSV